MDLADVYRILHPTSAQYTFFSAAHGTLSKTDHLRAQSKPQQISENRNNLLDHNALKLELNNKNNSRKHANNSKLNNTFLND
jgi:hypothetical protein